MRNRTVKLSANLVGSPYVTWRNGRLCVISRSSFLAVVLSSWLHVESCVMVIGFYLFYRRCTGLHGLSVGLDDHQLPFLCGLSLIERFKKPIFVCPTSSVSILSRRNNYDSQCNELRKANAPNVTRSDTC